MGCDCIYASILILWWHLVPFPATRASSCRVSAMQSVFAYNICVHSTGECNVWKCKWANNTLTHTLLSIFTSNDLRLQRWRTWMWRRRQYTWFQQSRRTLNFWIDDQRISVKALCTVFDVENKSQRLESKCAEVKTIPVTIHAHEKECRDNGNWK